MQPLKLPKILKNLGLLGVFATLSISMTACGGGDDELEYVERPVEALYNGAIDALEEKKYREAVLYFDEVERQHPYSVWARRSMLMSSFANYEMNKYVEAIDAAERFIALHPGNRDVAYAYYLIAISYYERIRDVGRDQQLTEHALDALREVTRRFPTTEYARDARLKIDLTLDHLAGKEMNVGRYYQNANELIAAINRFRNVIEQYQTTSHVPEALHRLTECYLALGIPHEAQTAAAVLGHNYPGTRWYQDSYALLTGQNLKPIENDKSWISNAWSSVF